ncbi:hypothetical protein NQ317_015855 [Molorchus minor]|uniref:MADF domain-containing protein n=1 Tax=Molorchus minor TaxID=1323400 RepID=A0ABQ9IS30_9CUCU|nr:hypothetical protein NQ317_015855 [Molorchus minor]
MPHKCICLAISVEGVGKVTLCKRKWDVLRATFRRAHKIGKSGIKRKPWRHYKRMSFLIPFTKSELSEEITERLKQEQPFRTEPETSPTFKENEEEIVLEDKVGVDKANANIQFFTSMAMTINTFPTEHQVRIKMMLLQQVSEVQLLLENLPPPDYPSTHKENM